MSLKTQSRIAFALFLYCVCVATVLAAPFILS